MVFSVHTRAAKEIYMICHIDLRGAVFDRAAHGPVRIRSAISSTQLTGLKGACAQCPPTSQGEGLDPGRIGGEVEDGAMAVSLLENNRANPTLRMLEAIAACLDVRFVDLFETRSTK
jgi:hypothetical protein